MSSDRYGEYIYLSEVNDGGFYTEEFVVRGHVAPDEFKAAIRELAIDYGEEIPELSAPWHAYAFWGFGSEDGWRSFNVTNKRGRGRFPVTVAEPASNVRDREQSAANRELLCQRLKSKYPEIEIISASGRPDHWEHQAYARFRFPGGKYEASVAWHSSDDIMWARFSQCDLDPWSDYAEVAGGAS